MDDSFINDCLDKDTAAVAYWKAFRQAHPEYLEVLEEARRCVLAMYTWGQSTEIEEGWDKLQEMITTRRPDSGLRVVGPDEGDAPARRRWGWGIGAAAIVAGILILTGIWIYKEKRPEPEAY